MVKEIPKPEINFKFEIKSDYKFYINENNEYFLTNDKDLKVFFNLNGEYHRLNKPAAYYYYGSMHDEYPDYDFSYYQNGFLHREDGKAVCPYPRYYLNGIMLEKPEFAERTRHLLCDMCKGFCNQKCFF